MRSSACSMRSAGPAALIAATGCPVWSRTATLQLLAALPFVPFGQTGGEPALLEFDRGHNPLREDVLAAPLTFADSSVDVPQGPGLASRWTRTPYAVTA